MNKQSCHIWGEENSEIIHENESLNNINLEDSSQITARWCYISFHNKTSKLFQG